MRLLNLFLPRPALGGPRRAPLPGVGDPDIVAPPESGSLAQGGSSNDVQEVLLSRPAVTSPWGKNDSAIDVNLPTRIHDEVVMLAGLEGKTKGEWVRDLIIRELRGCVEFARMRYSAVDRKQENDG
jgi:hypothetical protein